MLLFLSIQAFRTPARLVRHRHWSGSLPAGVGWDGGGQWRRLNTTMIRATSDIGDIYALRRCFPIADCFVYVFFFQFAPKDATLNGCQSVAKLNLENARIAHTYVERGIIFSHEGRHHPTKIFLIMPWLKLNMTIMLSNLTYQINCLPIILTPW